MRKPWEQTWWVRPEKYCQGIVWRKAEDSPREDAWGEHDDEAPLFLESDTGHAGETDDDTARLIAAAPVLYRALAAVEWSETDECAPDGGARVCPACCKYKSFGHASDCALNAALRAARGET